MDFVIQAALVTASVINVLLALIILANNSKSYINRIFGVFLLFVPIWAIGDLIMLYSRDISTIRIGTLMFYLGPMVTTYFVLWFSAAFPDDRRLSMLRHAAYFTPFVIFFAVILINQDILLDEVVISESGLNSIVPRTPGYLFYALFFNIYFAVAYFNFISAVRRSSGRKRSQVILSMIGILLASIPAVFTNTTLPLQGTYDLVWLGPIFTLSFTVTTTTAIVKHRLFDLRVVVARAVAYILLFSVFIGSYAVLAGVLTEQFSEAVNEQYSQIVFILFALIIAVAYGPLKNLLDKATNRVFYRDAYDSGVVISQLNNLIVGNLALEPIILGVIDIVDRNLKASNISILISGKNERVYSVKDSGKVDKELQEVLFDDLRNDNVRVLDVVESSIDPLKRELLIKHNIDIAGLLMAGDEVLGSIYLGPKKGGNTYTNQDLKVFSTIVSELALSVQNGRRFEEIESFNTKLKKEIDEATRDLKKTNEKLKALDEAKDEFISMASHQLRTPLTSIKGYISMVMEGDAGKISGKQEELLSEAFTSSQRMVYLIADLLNVSRLKTGKFVIEKSPINLADVVEGEMKQLTETAKSRNLKLVFNKPASFPEIELDETKTRQVIMNFADNAIYYTPAGGKIEIQLKATKDTIEYRVVDNGIGVKKEDQKHLFTKFFRASNAKKARPDGTGLGLYMAQKVITAQKGAVIFESKEGKGSTFGFSFPRHSKAKKKASSKAK